MCCQSTQCSIKDTSSVPEQLSSEFEVCTFFAQKKVNYSKWTKWTEMAVPIQTSVSENASDTIKYANIGIG